ncbi:alkane hydroxylase MAH1-like [Euphorbia lathyris]|uniref:alkane hydroxylase MAH1-like n=1 Tax=Euphorbia lathyris TaxID=212925 RepID=UPI0033139DA8
MSENEEMAAIGYAGMLIASFSIVFLLIIWSKRKSVVINWPVFGMLPGLAWNISRVHDFATDLLMQNGGTFMFKGPWFTGMDFVLTSDPMNVNHFLSRNFSNYLKGNEYKEIFEPLGDGILAVDSDIWKIQRRIIHSLFHNKRFKAAVERILNHKISNGLFPVLENASKLGNVVDLQDIVQRLTFDNICMLIVGFDPKCLSVELPRVAIEKAFHDMEEAGLHRHLVPSSIWKLQRFLQVGKEKTFRIAWKVLESFVVQHISSKRQQQLNQLETDDFNVLTYFLSEVEENGINIKSDKFLTDMAFNLLGAGRDTIAAALVWFFWAVGTHPLVEKKIYQEMKDNLQMKENHTFSFEELNKLVYLHAVICEVLRLYPTIPFDHMMSIEEDTLPSGIKIPGNQKLIYSLYSMGRMEEIWGKDCLEFRPERWISKNGEIVHVPSYKFIAFNTGPRSCLGKNLTFIQMKAIASAVISNYCFQVVRTYPAKPTPSIVLYMKDGLEVRVSKRHN